MVLWRQELTAPSFVVAEICHGIWPGTKGFIVCVRLMDNIRVFANLYNNT